MRYLVPCLSRDRTGFIFPTRPRPIFDNLSNWGTDVISSDPEKVNLLASARVCVNFPVLPGAHRLEFLRTIASLLPHLAKLGYLCDFARFRDGQYFSTCSRVRKFPYPLGSAPVGIFTHDRFLSSSFSLILVSVRFHAIP